MALDERIPPAVPGSQPVGSADSLQDSATGVATEAVRRMTRVRPRRGPRARWIVVALVTAVTIVASTAGLVALSVATPASALVRHVPAGTVGYLELRLDAPGDQSQQAADLLAHFPGFADQSSLGTKLDQALDQLVGQVSNGSQTFTGDLKNWLGDTVAVAVTRLPAAGTAGTGVGPSAEAGLLLVSVKDPAAARAWAETTFGPGTGSETYGGVALTTFGHRGATGAFGVVSNVLLMGDTASVHEVIDTNGSSGFADTASFKAALAAIAGDRLAFGFLDVRAVIETMTAARPSPAASLALAAAPAWVAVVVRAESDSVSATVALPRTSLAPATSNHVSRLADRLPAGTIAAGEVHDLALIIGAVTAAMPAGGADGSGTGPGAQALAALGGIDGLVGWMGDATFTLIRTQGTTEIAGGVVIQARDAAAAETRLLQLKNLVALAGGDAGATVSDETHDGTSITIIDIGDAVNFMGGRALPGLASGAHVQLAIAQKDDLVIAGLGDAFVKAVLDTKPGASLADRDIYRNAVDRAGSSNAGQFFVDLREVMELASTRLPAERAQHYQSDIRPYLDPFSAVAAAGFAGDPSRARIVIVVK